MARDKAFRAAEKKIKDALRSGVTELALIALDLTELPESIGGLTQLRSLDISVNRISALPESLGNLSQLESLNIGYNQLTTLPESIGNLKQLQSIIASGNTLLSLPESLANFLQLRKLTFEIDKSAVLPPWLGRLDQLEVLYFSKENLVSFPEWIRNLTNLRELAIYSCSLTVIPDWLGGLTKLQMLWLANNKIASLPDTIVALTQLNSLVLQLNGLNDIPTTLLRLKNLQALRLSDNPLNPELAEAYSQGLDAVKAYLRAKAQTGEIVLNETKLILVGEGEVGKSCLMDALQDMPWQEHASTHGIEIKPFKVTDLESNRDITLNGWDFGGQRVYRPTHQLFFSAPAVYLVVWKPREGPQQGFVREWIQLIKRREPDAKVLVVATHGGPGQRQPDIDRQELRDLFGNDTVLDFFHVDSKPDLNGKRRGIEELKRVIARVAAGLPEMGRSVPKSFQEVREALTKTGAAYLKLDRVLAICREHKMDDESARLYLTISHRLGHLIHYQHDPSLRDIVVLKPDWLATAISFVLDDELTRKAHGLVRFSHLNRLWDDETRKAECRYPTALHSIFLRLMDRFDLSYRVADPLSRGETDPQSLIAQLVPDNRPDPVPGWAAGVGTGDIQQEQICRIVDERGQSANAEGLFYQLIVRLHKFSLGRVNYNESVHWQRGLVLDDDYNGRALLEHVGNDVRITVRAPYPERLLSVLTSEVKYLVDSFWNGLRCDVMVPCISPCGKNAPGTGLYEVEKLIESKKQGRPDYPCPVCNEWQNIDCLLRNAPAARPMSLDELLATVADMKDDLRILLKQGATRHTETLRRFDGLDVDTQRILSKVDDAFTGLMRALTDEAKEGPRLFSFVPVGRTSFNPKQWTSAKFRLTLWCEHSRVPLPILKGKDSKVGVYEIELTRDWFKKAAPALKVLTGTLSLVLPVASSGLKLGYDETIYKTIADQLDFGKEIIDASLEGSEKVVDWLDEGTGTDLEHGAGIRARGATLRELHALLKVKDPGFGGLIRVMNKRQEFLWVHPQFEKEY